MPAGFVEKFRVEKPSDAIQEAGQNPIDPATEYARQALLDKYNRMKKWDGWWRVMYPVDYINYKGDRETKYLPLSYHKDKFTADYYLERYRDLIAGRLIGEDSPEARLNHLMVS